MSTQLIKKSGGPIKGARKFLEGHGPPIETPLSMVLEKYAFVRHWIVSEKYCPWVTILLKAAARTRDRLRKSSVKAESEILMTAYRHIRNSVHKQNKALKRQYFSEEIRPCKGDMREKEKILISWFISGLKKMFLRS